MKTIKEIVSGVWFSLGIGQMALGGRSTSVRFRLDERDTDRLIAFIEANGWVIMPRKPTEEMVVTATRALGRHGFEDATSMIHEAIEAAYADLIEARPRHDDIGKPAEQAYGEGGFGA